MGFRILGSAEPKYLAATDVLIGDMSNINYEFLLFDRPVILLANQWVDKHFPQIGIKTDLNGLEGSIQRSLLHSHEFKKEREFWMNQTMFLPDKGANKFCIDLALEKSGFRNPSFVLIDGNNLVRKTNLEPLYYELESRTLPVKLIHKYEKEEQPIDQTIFIGAHCNDIKMIEGGYSIHIDHDLKGPSTANLAHAKRDYVKNHYYQNIDLHITAGEAGKIRTEYLLSNNTEKVIIGGYPKADDFLRLNTKRNKVEVCKELGFDPTKPLVTYAPAGIKKYMKPGGSLNKSVIDRLMEIEKNTDINILVKVKYSKSRSLKEAGLNLLKYLYSQTMKTIYSDGGSEWDEILKQIEKKNKPPENPIQSV